MVPRSARVIYICLVSSLMQLLMDSDYSEQYQDLKPQLELLQHVLTLIGLVIQGYRHTSIISDLDSITADRKYKTKNLYGGIIGHLIGWMAR